MKTLRIRKIARKVLEIPPPDPDAASWMIPQLRYIKKQSDEAGRAYDEACQEKARIKAFDYWIEVGNLYKDLMDADEVRLDQIRKDAMKEIKQRNEKLIKILFVFAVFLLWFVAFILKGLL